MIRFDLSMEDWEKLERLKGAPGFKVLESMRDQLASQLMALAASAKTETVTRKNKDTDVATTETAEAKMKGYTGQLQGFDLVIKQIKEAGTMAVKKGEEAKQAQ
jgi:hypothetical protein